MCLFKKKELIYSLLHCKHYEINVYRIEFHIVEMFFFNFFLAMLIVNTKESYTKEILINITESPFSFLPFSLLQVGMNMKMNVYWNKMIFLTLFISLVLIKQKKNIG